MCAIIHGIIGIGRVFIKIIFNNYSILLEFYLMESCIVEGEEHCSVFFWTGLTSHGYSFVFGQNVFPSCPLNPKNFLPKFTYPKTLRKNFRPSGGIPFPSFFKPKISKSPYKSFLAEKFPGKWNFKTSKKKTINTETAELDGARGGWSHPVFF